MLGIYFSPKPPAKPELKDLVSAANEVAKTARDVLTAMLVVALTLAATMIAATDEALLRDSAEVFPGLGAKVKLSTVFLLAPIVFVFLHANALLQLHLLAGRIRGLNTQMEAQGLDETTRRSWRRMIHGFAFAQLLAGEDGEIGAGRVAHRLLLVVMSWLAVTAVPVVLLVCTQVSFVRYQSEPITLAHQITLGADLTLLLWFHFAHWGRVVSWWWGSASWSACALAAIGGLGWLSITQALPPGPEVEELGGSIFDDICEWPGLAWSCRYLYLYEKTIINNDVRPELIRQFSDEDTVLKGRQSRMVSIDLSGRTLRFAFFGKAQLFSANLRNIRAENSWWAMSALEGADLSGASLRGAYFPSASLRGAKIRDASLQGVNFSGASLQGADLSGASLRGSNLSSASLSGTNFREASLRGADLSWASLQGAMLSKTLLEGADLQGASLQGAMLSRASLHGANLASASLQGADLRGASLQGANLRGVNVGGGILFGGTRMSLTTGKILDCNRAFFSESEDDDYDLDNLESSLNRAKLPTKRVRQIVNRVASQDAATCTSAKLPIKTNPSVDWAKARVAAACSHPAAARGIINSSISEGVYTFLAAWAAETCPAVMAAKRERGEVK